MNHEFRLLGPWEFWCGQDKAPVPGGQLRILLTSLLLSANLPVGVDMLAEQLWPEHPPRRTRDSVYLYIGRLRKLLGPGIVIHTQPGGYQLTIDPGAVDVHRFRDLLSLARRAPTAGEELAHLRAALRLWRGIPFADLYSTWLDREVAPRLTEEWFAATARRIELELDAGRPEPLIAELRDLTGSHPARESLWRLLIIALGRAGRRAEALEAYQRVRATLRDELGLEPSERLVALQREILLDGSTGPADEVTVEAPAPQQLPHDIARFTGRDNELTTLDTLLPYPAVRTPTIISIDGAPGVGKTTLAVHWAHRVAHRYPTQIYVNLRGYGPGDPVTPSAAAETMLRALGVRSELIPSQPEERSALLRSTLARGQVLLLLDNARDAQQVRPLLPGTKALVIVTSRNQLRGLSVEDGARRVTLRPLHRKHSVQLLAGVVGQRWVAEDPAAAIALVELCDRLPLAIAIVAERAQRAGSLAEVVAALENEQARLDTVDTGEAGTRGNLRAALSWSYKALGAGAAAMFRMLGLHPARDISARTAAAIAGVPVAQAQAALDQLVATHLVEQRRPGRFELHDLIRLYANEMARADEATDRDATVRRTLDWYLHAASSADRMLISRRHNFLAPYEPAGPLPAFGSALEAGAWFEQEYECLRSIVAWAAEHGFAGHAWRIAMTMTTFFDKAIPWQDGVEFYRLACAAARDAGEPEGEGYTLNSLGCIHLDMSDWNSAKAYFEQSLTRFRASRNRFGQALAHGNLALAHGELGDGAAAARHCRQALKLCKELDYPRGIVCNLDNLGVAHLIAGDYQRAVEYVRQAQDLAQQLGDAELIGLGQLHLAQAYRRLHDIPNATNAFRQSAITFSTTGNRRWSAIVLADLGTMLSEVGHSAAARPMLRAALTMLTEFAHPRAREVEATLAAAN